MISLHCTCRRLRQSHSLTRSLTRSLTTTTTSDISSFINQVSTLEKSQQWSSISHALSSCSDPQAIAQHSLTLCAASIKGNSSQDELWSTDHTTLPPCTYGTLLHASVEAKNLDQLTILLGETRAEPAVAAAIGVGGLFNYYSPFIETSSTSAADPMKRQALDSEIETRIVGHFQEWVGNMDQRATLTQSQLLFSHMHSLYKNDIEQMVNFIDKHFASGTSTESNALTTYELLTSIDEARATTFTLTAYDFLAAHDIVKATEFLKVVRERGNLDLASIKLNQYSDMVWRSIPLAWSPSSTNPDTDKTFKKQNKLKRQKQCFSPESVEVDVNLANYIARSSGMESPLDNDVTGHEIGEFQSSDVDFACIKNNLDNLFYLANGSSGFDMKLRHTFYKNLLNCNRPRTLLAYEQLRRKQESLFYSSNGEQGTPLSLDVEGYKCVIKAHANQLNAKGILKTLSDWNQTGRLISTSTVGNKLQTPFATPDSSVYKTVISIFYVHPHMITSKNLEKLFDQMQQDNVTPDETKDILALFKFANKAKSVPMTKTLLDWVDSMMESEVPASDSTTDTTISDFDTALINSVVPKRSFSKADLVKMYDLALETNSAEIDNGDICLDILFTMKKHKISLNGNRVALVMKAFKNSKNFDAVLELFHSMSALKVKRDTYHVSLAVVAYVRTDQVAKGLALLNRFESAGQSLKTFAYFAAAFEIMRRLCVKPHFIPFPVTNASGETEEMSQKEAMIKCIDLFLFAMENEELYAGSKNHLQTSIKLLDPFIYEEMIQYIEYRLVNDSESQPLDTASTTSLPPAPERLLKLFKELKKLANRNQTHR